MTGRLRETLSKMETMPDAALPHLQWAFDMIVDRRISLTSLLPLLNERLQGAGVELASKSGLHRWAQRIRDGEIKRPGGRPIPPATMPISPETLRLLAAALRSLADDLEQGS